MTDWQARALAAEKGMARARRCLRLTPLQQRVLRVLGELRSGETMTVHQLVDRFDSAHSSVKSALDRLVQFGLVDVVVPGEAQRPDGRIGPMAHGYKLGYLVVPGEQMIDESQDDQDDDANGQAPARAGLWGQLA